MKHNQIKTKPTLKVGVLIGQLTLISYVPPQNSAPGKWVCVCSCGTQKLVRSEHLRSGDSVSCGCYNRAQDLTGSIMGDLKVIGLDSKRGAVRYWHVACVCGKQLVRPGPEIKRNNQCKHGVNDKRLRPPGESAFSLLLKSYKKAACNRDLSFELLPDQFRQLTESNCNYCGSFPEKLTRFGNVNGQFKYNGIDRVDNRQGYTVSNSVSCCATCNWMKGVLGKDTFIERCIRVANHQSAELT